MTRDELIRMAVQCQLVNAGNREGLYMDALAEFAELVASAEREECREICRDLYYENIDNDLLDASLAIGERGEA